VSPEQPFTKEEIILAAARKRFAHFGFSKVTMDEIASDVGMAKPSLYYYYATKERLFDAVIRQEQQQFAADVGSMLKRRTSAAQKLKDYVGIRLHLFRELVNLSQLGFDSWAEMKTVSRDLFRSLEQQELDFLQTILAEGRASGEFSPPHPQQAALIMLHVLQGLRMRMLRSASPPGLSESDYAGLRRESELVIDYILSGIGKQS